jgi:hypothetical protein
VTAAPAAPLAAAHRLLVRQGVALFDHGSYWHAHEAWEQVWRAERVPNRHFLKGLIQVAAALHHVQAGRRAVGERLVERARAHLDAHTGERWGFRTEALVHALSALSQRLAHGEPADPPLLARLMHPS